MTQPALNLARRPFVNTRPVRRVAVALWVVGGLLAVGNGALYWSHFSGQGAKRQRLQELDEKIRGENARIAELEAALQSLDLVEQNRQVRFVNERIAERTFNWSRLFDRLAEVLPDQVRLNRLSPRIIPAGGRPVAGARSLDQEQVLLQLNGAAQTGEAVLQFVDNLFRHPSFLDPSPSSETQSDGSGVLSFSMTVSYLPQVTPPPPGAAAAAAQPAGDAPAVGEAAAAAPAPPPAGDPGAQAGEGGTP